MVGILADDDDLGLLEGAEVEGIEYLRAGGIARPLPVLGAYVVGQVAEVGGLELALQACAPRWLYLDGHGLWLAGEWRRAVVGVARTGVFCKDTPKRRDDKGAAA